MHNTKDIQLIKDIEKVYQQLESLQRLQSLERLESLQSLESLQILQSLERLQILQSLESLQRLQSPQSLQRLELNNLDYRDVKLPAPDSCVIYLDPPYRNTG